MVRAMFRVLVASACICQSYGHEFRGTENTGQGISTEMHSNPTQPVDLSVDSPNELSQGSTVSNPPASLLQPCLLSYLIQVAAAGCVARMTLSNPLPLLVVLAGSVSLFGYSWVANVPIWNYVPGSTLWWLWLAKMLIVNVAAAAPTLLALRFKWTSTILEGAGMLAYVMLWLNIVWTIPFSIAGDAIDKTDSICAVSLCVSLIVRMVALQRANVPSFKLDGGMLLGFGTSLSWLICYTVWNALFVCHKKGAAQHTLQDILFWCMMYWFYSRNGHRGSIEDYFAMARPAQLAAYLTLVDVFGLVPFFRNAPVVGHAITRHPYFLFLAILNIAYSFYVLSLELWLLKHPSMLQLKLVDPKKLPE